ncbi:hypothetical protein CPB86DRAFT_787858 [Serendipita vermifera]|nr:hypothetical protein CPB86DRAFT_787858 [Serendipita vermifera]
MNKDESFTGRSNRSFSLMESKRTETMEMPFSEEPIQESEEILATRSRLTQNPSLLSARPDAGYLPKGWRRVLREEEPGKGQQWYYTRSEKDDEDAKYQLDPPGPEADYVPPDNFLDTDLFPDDETTVQIVEFRKDAAVPAKWYAPLNTPDAVTATLAAPPLYEHAWRWVHCSGLHGPTLKAVALATGWHLRKFGGIFTWTRASMEWADDVILVHFQNQGTRIFIWYGGGKYPVLITCSTLNPRETSITRLFDFVDRGCSRPEVVLRTDPSLLFYGVVRAVIQDLRFSAHDVSEKIRVVFEHGVSRPSHSKLEYFYYLQDRLYVLSLDATGLKNAAINLNAAADKMHERFHGTNDPKRLISERSKVLLRDQMGLIDLLSQELPDINRRAQAIVDLAFNMLAFGTNGLLQLLAVITLATSPLMIATGVLGMNYFDENRITGKQIAIIFATIGGTVVGGLTWFSFWFFRQRTSEEHDGSRLPTQKKNLQTGNLLEDQTDAQRQAWAATQDLVRDNFIVTHKRLVTPMMKQFEMPSPQGTIPLSPTEHAPTSPRRGKTMSDYQGGSLYRRTRMQRYGSSPPRNLEAAAEEGKGIMGRFRPRTQTSPVGSTSERFSDESTSPPPASPVQEK